MFFLLFFSLLTVGECYKVRLCAPRTQEAEKVQKSINEIEEGEFKRVGCLQFNTSESDVFDCIRNFLDIRFCKKGILRTLEKKIADLHGVKHAVLTRVGINPLFIAFSTFKDIYEWEDGCEVIVPAFAPQEVFDALKEVKLKSVCVDAEEHFLKININKIEGKITPQTKVILCFQSFNQPADMNEITKIVNQYNLKLIEVLCAPLFVRHENKMLGSFGDISCLLPFRRDQSYDCAVLLTDNSEFAFNMLSIQSEISNSLEMSYGAYSNKKNISCRSNIEISELRNALEFFEFEAKFEKLKRIEHNCLYLRNKLQILNKYLYLPLEGGRALRIEMMPLVVLGRCKEALTEYLRLKGIETFPMLQCENNKRLKEFPIARSALDRGFYVGCHSGLSDRDLDYIVDTFHEFFIKQEIKDDS